MPDTLLTIQGEVMRSNEELHFLYSTVPKPMNIALKEESKSAMNLFNRNRQRPWQKRSYLGSQKLLIFTFANFKYKPSFHFQWHFKHVKN